MPVSTVKVPEAMEPLFEQAEKYVKQYFSTRIENPQKGTIEIGGERYILVRAVSMSVNFFEYIKTLYPGLNEAEANNVTGSVLFDIAHGVGSNDALAFHKAMNLKTAIEKISSGPVHFAYTGWAFVELGNECRPSPDVNSYLVYDHPQSFEADSWIKMERASNSPVCFMNAGYSAGWGQVSFGVDITVKEVLCRAKGDKYCRFIMGHPSKIDGYVREYKEKNPELFGNGRV